MAAALGDVDVDGGAAASPFASRPDALKHLRACLVCKLVKTQRQFDEEQCDNCGEEWRGGAKPSATERRALTQENTTTDFVGTVAMMRADSSWVARWLRMHGKADDGASVPFKLGLYAIALPSEEASATERARRRGGGGGGGGGGRGGGDGAGAGRSGRRRAKGSDDEEGEELGDEDVDEDEGPEEQPNEDDKQFIDNSKEGEGEGGGDDDDDDDDESSSDEDDDEDEDAAAKAKKGKAKEDDDMS